MVGAKDQNQTFVSINRWRIDKAEVEGWLWWCCGLKYTPLEALLGLDVGLHAILQFYWVINSPCDLKIRSLCRASPVCFLSHCHTTSPLHHPTSRSSTRWGKARRCDLWHLNQGALKSLLNKTDGLGRLDWQGDWLTGPEAKRDPEAAALKCRRQHTGGGRGGGRVLAVTGLTD